MANRNARVFDVNDVINQLYDDSSSSDDETDIENDVEEDLEEILRNANVVQEIEMEQCERDRENADDVLYGWTRDGESGSLMMPFLSNVGLTCEIPESPEPIDFFNMLFDDDFWQIMVNETNRYAQRKIDNDNLKPHSRFRSWKPVTYEEMKIFFALVISMGLTKKNDISDYWSTEEVLSTPLFGKSMSKDRFLLILSNLYLADNETAIPRGEPGHDKLHKVRPFISMIKANFGKYDPEQDLSFDEGTCPFKGRVHFRVYNPNKPNKFGMKLYQVCEASSGYCLGFDVYHGDTDCIAAVDTLESLDDNGHPSDHYANLTTTSKIVLGLLTMTGLLWKGHHVYMDNNYTSPELFEELDIVNTYACGTVRVNRKGVPKAFPNVKKMKQGDVIFRRKSNMMAVKFHDKRDIHMLTTIHESKMVLADRVDRRTQEPIFKPLCIVQYIKKMGGVDLNDQIVQYYEVLRKCVKWWKKLFLHLFNLLMVNAYVLYKKYGQNIKKKSHLEFRMQIVKSLIDSAPNALKPSRGGRKSDPIDRLLGRHFIGHIPAKDGAKRN